ncbi:M15 family metallopeptidase [Beijerinckia indica]|uniref:D-alanyl-D-alanine dipeptidase n=1 Tax=Beijerinckia indica subsp. indica (strain ATCC 9039 / DSM 1715 / NCIMB 8712) TaxID=395963 RepID=B2IJ85_BEII9|nr:peptidase M15D vanX D-ala-D-ala dipeptidase [Beijerinckia indica subsp. indica ATCC 9039]
MGKRLLSAFAMIMLSCAGVSSAVAKGVEKETLPPPDFVRLQDVAPSIAQDMRYAGSNNFTGRPVPGYAAGTCWLRREAALALAAVQKDAEAEGLGLVVFDCFRPQRASNAFLAWAQDPTDQAMKAAYYPGIDKRVLFDQGYIAAKSTHSTGLAVDLGFIGRDFGTPFDLFDAASATDFQAIDAEAKANRDKLLSLMRKHGFENLPNEWWHFNLPGAAKAEFFDFEVR